LAKAFRKDARSAQVKVEEVEEGVGPLEKGIGKLVTVDRLIPRIYGNKC
jgi:hypothetical protein